MPDRNDKGVITKFVTAAICSDCHTPHQNQPASDPDSSIHPDHLQTTCQTCHPDATASFVSFDPHADPTSPDARIELRLIYLFMTALLIGVFGFFGIQQFVNISQLTGLVIGLTLYNSAVLAEIFRAGILSLSKGQSEAASSLGMTYWQSMQLVILPQAIRRMTPAIVAQLATLTKDTSLGFVIGYQEIMRRAQVLGQGSPNNLLQSYVVVGILYFIVIFGLSRLARRLEVQQRRKYGAGKMAGGAGMEDVEVLGEEADEDEAAQREPAKAVSG